MVLNILRQSRPAVLPDDEAARVRLAARPGTPPGTLRLLADDPAVTVRAAVAMNPAYAPAATARLLADADERVRALLADKVARLLPSLEGVEHRAAQAHIHRTLVTLADDAAVRVRMAIADILTTMPEAPREVILKLARDSAVAVSVPILRLSPLLTDTDLLDLLATPAHASTATAVAARLGLSAPVADRIAEQADGAAIRALLQNRSATIQEATLDSLIGRAGDHPEWHEPLVRRPTLPERASRALARIVSGTLLAVLVQRADLPPHVADELARRMEQSMEPEPPQTEAEVLDNVRLLNSTGKLTEAALIEAAQTGDNRQVAAILAVASGVTLAMLDRSVALRSAKALVSLVWKAGFSMNAGLVVQKVLGQLGPSEWLVAGEHGAFPLSADEMEWQIELLGEPGS